MFGQSRRRKRGRRPLGGRAEPELSQLQVVIESRDPGCQSYPHLASSEACEYGAQPLTAVRSPPAARTASLALAFQSCGPGPCRSGRAHSFICF